MSRHSNICKICESETKQIFTRTILQRHKISYFQCPKCGFTQTEEAFWLPEAYESSMNLGDTGQVIRSIQNSIKLKFVLSAISKPTEPFLDYAGGYGILTRLMRDLGFNFFWEDKFTKNLLASGFEGASIKYSAVTVFECFEHWENPMIEIQNLFEKTDTIIFSTNIISDPAPKEWWYYGFDHGQHISFFSRNSLKFIAEKFGCYFYSKAGIHIFSKNKISSIKLFSGILRAKILLKILDNSSKKSLTTSDHIFLTKIQS